MRAIIHHRDGDRGTTTEDSPWVSKEFPCYDRISCDCSDSKILTRGFKVLAKRLLR
jgi:hypothetical protein